MATIEVGGMNEGSAPSPAQLNTWHGDWAQELAALTAWAPHPDDSETNYRCTTTSTVAATEAVVGAALTTWRELDSGHRHFSVT